MELLKNLEGLSADEQMSAVVELQKAAMKHLEEQKQASIGKSAEMVILGLKKIKSDFEAKFDSLNYDIQTKVANLKDGEQGLQGQKGEKGDRGLDGAQGKDGKPGIDGKDGLDGKDGVSVQDAKIDFDGSLVITLSDGREINVGEVVPVDVAQTIHKIQSGSGGDSQTTLNAIAALQATIATYGTMATQNANNVAITGGTINNTTIGATTPSTGVFTTLTATGQTSLGGVAGSESLRVLSPVATGSYLQVQSSSSAFVEFRALGTNSNNTLGFVSRGSGTVSFYTNNSTSNEQLRVSPTASAVNYHQLTGAATGSGPIHSVAGSDTNIDLNLTTKGTGVLNLNTGSGTQVRIIDSGGTAVNRIHLQGQGTGFLPVIASRGSDTNLGMSYSTQGTGGHDFYTAGTSFTQQVKIAHTASAVNYVQVTGAATGNFPVIYGNGSDTNISTAISTKGFSSFIFFTVSGTTNFRSFAVSTSGASDGGTYLQVKGNPAGTAPVLSAQGNDTNIPLVVQPKGTGALQAQQTDSTATGGNARGANAVDWQTVRGAANQVASGTYAIVAGGANNQVTGALAVISGGGFSQATGQYSVISGGAANATGQYGAAVVAGQGNNAGGWLTFIGGGYTNSTTASTTVTTQATTTVTSGSTAVTLSGSNANIKVGQLITGTGINTPTYVAAISGTSLTLSQNANATGTPTLSFFTPHGVVVGGGNNQATGSYSFIGGGGDAGTAANRNVASGDWSFVGGGTKNVASGIGSVIAGGGTEFNTNFGNTASGSSSVVGGGILHTASGIGSAITSGWQNTATGVLSTVVGGRYGTTRAITGNIVFPANNAAVAGGAQGIIQAALLTVGTQTTNATATVLTSDGAVASTTNQVILPNNSAYAFRGTVIANVTGGGNTKAWAIEGAIKRGANAASTALVGTPTVVSGFADAGAATWAITATADTTNGGLAITFTGQAATTIRVVAKLETTEVTF